MQIRSCILASATAAALLGTAAAAQDGRPAAEIATPAVKDWSTLAITLRRTLCFGSCPAYVVVIGGDGTVHYTGENFVAVTGQHQTHIPTESVQALFQEFEKVHFFSALDTYRARITDLPTYSVTLAYDGYAKTVTDYGGRAVGMPAEISALENAIDAAAGTKTWVRGDENTFAGLEAEHWDFRANDDVHSALLVAAARRGDAEFLGKLLAAGMSARNASGCRALAYGARAANVDIVGRLIQAGAPMHVDAPKGREYEICDVLGVAAGSDSPQMIRTILNLHPDVNWRDQNGNTALMTVAGIFPGKNFSDSDAAAVAKLLIDAGADVNAHDRRGASAITMVRASAGIVRVLLAAGATDINMQDSTGDTVLMKISDPNVAQALLEGGADPWIVNNRGQNALEAVTRTYGNSPAAPILRRWMEAHPKPG